MNVDHQESLEAEVARLRQENERLERVADYQLQAANKALRKADAAERELARIRQDVQIEAHARQRNHERAEAAERELARLQEGLRAGRGRCDVTTNRYGHDPARCVCGCATQTTTSGRVPDPQGVTGLDAGPKPYPEGSGSLGPGRCSICGTPWVFNVAGRLWVAVCGCHQEKPE